MLRQLNTSYYGARLQFINENGGQDILDSETFINLHNAADELMVVMLRKAKELGIDTNSRQLEKHFILLSILILNKEEKIIFSLGKVMLTEI